MFIAIKNIAGVFIVAGILAQGGNYRVLVSCEYSQSGVIVAAGTLQIKSAAYPLAVLASPVMFASAERMSAGGVKVAGAVGFVSIRSAGGVIVAGGVRIERR